MFRIRSISNKISKKFNDFHKTIRKQRGEILRQKRGDFLENLIVDCINMFNISGVSAKRYDKLVLKSKNGYTKNHGTDVHIYKHDSLIAAIECKSYVDSCFYERTCSDMNIFKKCMDKNVTTVLVTLENGIKDETQKFLDDMYDKPIDHTFYLTSYKRKSSKPLWTRYRDTKTNKKLINDFAKNLQKIINSN